MTRTRLQIAADRRAADQRRELTDQISRLMGDSGTSQRRLATAAGVGQGFLSDLLAHNAEGTLETYHRLAAALGADVSMKLYANTGTHLRDRWQARMLEAVLRTRHPRWEPFGEVHVMHPVSGWIDLALHEPRERVLVANELQSELRRLEQLIRWHAAKAGALRSWEGFGQLGDAPHVSQLLVVRRTRATRQVAADFARQLRTAYPAHPDDAVAALTGTAAWPAAALAWMVVDGKGARFVPGR